MKVRQVGVIYPRKFRYKDVKTDLDGWADATKYLPQDYDLLFLKVHRHGMTHIISGWYQETKWFGVKLRKYDSVVQWKRKPDDIDLDEDDVKLFDNDASN